MFIYLHELRDHHQAANPVEYGKHYDAAYVVAYNQVFNSFVQALEHAVGINKLSVVRLDASAYPTLDIKTEVLANVTLSQVTGLAESVMVAHDHGRDEAVDDAFVDAVATVRGQLSK